MEKKVRVLEEKEEKVKETVKEEELVEKVKRMERGVREGRERET